MAESPQVLTKTAKIAKSILRVYFGIFLSLRGYLQIRVIALSSNEFKDFAYLA
jgi:hypothetical protein